MTLHTKIQSELKDAMRAKDEIRLTVIRSLLTAFTNELVSQKRKPDETLEDEGVLSVIRRAEKQRKDSIEQFRGGGRADLAEREESELAIIQGYLPQMMSRESVMRIVHKKKEDLGISDSKDKGKLMGAIMKDLKGRADGQMVKEVVDSIFNG